MGARRRRDGLVIVAVDPDHPHAEAFDPSAEVVHRRDFAGGAESLQPVDVDEQREVAQAGDAPKKSTLPTSRLPAIRRPRSCNKLPRLSLQMRANAMPRDTGNPCPRLPVANGMCSLHPGTGCPASSVPSA